MPEKQTNIFFKKCIDTMHFILEKMLFLPDVSQQGNFILYFFPCQGKKYYLTLSTKQYSQCRLSIK